MIFPYRGYRIFRDLSLPGLNVGGCGHTMRHDT
jgi:hypothetical protein